MRTLKLFFVVIATLGLGACSKSVPVSVTLVHYNVGVFDKYDQSSIEAVAEVIKALDADVVSLNEVDSCTVRTGKLDQLKTFAGVMGGWNYNYASAMPYDEGAYGVGVSSSPSMEVVSMNKVALPRLDGWEPRAMAVVEYKDFVFASTHLDLTPESQKGQLKVINDYFDNLCAELQKPVVLCGDFNCEPGNEIIESFKESWTLLSPIKYSFPSTDPIKCIDYIFVRANGGSVVVNSAEIPVNVAGKWLGTVSDHLPVVVNVTIK